MIRTEDCAPASPKPSVRELLDHAEQEQAELRAFLKEIVLKVCGRVWEEVVFNRESNSLLDQAGYLKAIEYDNRLLAKTIFESL